VTDARIAELRSRVGIGKLLSDDEVARSVRMLTRSQPDHELVCMVARDRVLDLSGKLESLITDPDAAIALRLARAHCEQLEARGDEIPAYAAEWWKAQMRADAVEGAPPMITVEFPAAESAQ
jgi:hypothetical protein